VRRQTVLEKSVVGRIVAALKKHPGVVVVRKRHGTAMGVAGDPDLYGTIRGQHFEIEVKRPGDASSQLTKLQTERLLEWTIAGAITGVARSAHEALVILGLKRPDVPVEMAVWLCSGCRDYRWQGTEPPARCPNCGHIHFEREAS
jgi:rubrerythrin